MEDEDGNEQWRRQPEDGLCHENTKSSGALFASERCEPVIITNTGKSGFTNKICEIFGSVNNI